MITQEKKLELIKKFGDNEKDSGKAEVQIAIITTRVKNLTEHLKVNKKDAHSRRGMRLLLGKRGSLLKYLKNSHIDRYRVLIQALNLKDRY